MEMRVRENEAYVKMRLLQKWEVLQKELKISLLKIFFWHKTISDSSVIKMFIFRRVSFNKHSLTYL